MTSGTIIAPEKAKPGTEEMFPLKITHVHSPRLFGLGSTFFFPRSFDWDWVPLVVSMSLFPLSSRRFSFCRLSRG